MSRPECPYGQLFYKKNIQRRKYFMKNVIWAHTSLKSPKLEPHFINPKIPKNGSHMALFFIK